ncbi:MAG: type II secretion system protein M, partial [Thermoplasmata archaeon]|nr:type II secretion system protein M [Thermoplasmata archaeon]
MARKLSVREELFLAIGALAVLVLVLYITLIKPTLGKISDLEREIPVAREKHNRVVLLGNTYRSCLNEREQLRRTMEARESEVELGKLITDIQRKLNFESQTSNPQSPEKITGGYIKSKLRVHYRNKSLDEIRNFLYEIEKPVHGIIIQSLKLTPDMRERKRFS